MKTVHKTLIVLLRRFTEAQTLTDIALDLLVDEEYGQLEVIINKLEGLGLLDKNVANDILYNVDRLKHENTIGFK